MRTPSRARACGALAAGLALAAGGLAVAGVCGCEPAQPGATGRPATVPTAGLRAPTGREEICCCGIGQLFIVNVAEARRDPSRRVWTWKPADSPRIAERHRSKWDVRLEGKPVMGGKAVLVCASYRGAVALVRRSDKACLFYAGGHGGHSADLIGDDLVAYALSTSRHELRLYRRPKDGPVNPKPAWTMPLTGGHAVVWDGARGVLWALGSAELLKLRVDRKAPSAEVLKRWKLPGAGGNDLILLDAEHLAVSTKEGVHRFHVASGTFSPMPRLAKTGPVKGMSLHPATGQLVYTVGDGQFTDTVRFLGGGAIVFKGLKLYKARWVVP